MLARKFLSFFVFEGAMRRAERAPREVCILAGVAGGDSRVLTGEAG